MGISENNKPSLFGKKAEHEIDGLEKNKLTQDFEHLTEEHQNSHNNKSAGFVGITYVVGITRHNDLPVIQPYCLLTEFSNDAIAMRNK